MSLTVRRAVPQDIPALLELETAFPGDRLSRRSFRHLLSKANAEVWVFADTQVRADAVVLYRRGSKRARLYSLVVQPGAQGRGLGTELLRWVERSAAARGCTVLFLELRHDNAAALHLYKTSGFELAGRTENYYDDGAACVTMRKALT